MLFNIQRWSLHDGPGIRTTLFFQGCPLRCRWCSNPESWEFERKSEQTHLGKNQHNQYFPTDEIARVIDTITRDAVFYRASGGGVTFSGGEALAQPELLRYLADTLSAAGIPTAVETCGLFDFTQISDILEMINDIFIDLKQTDDAMHKTLTGVSNGRIIENIHRIDEMGKTFVIRIPLVKNLTDTPENIDKSIDICATLKNLIRVELLPYHSLGVGKYVDLNLPYDNTMAAPDQERIESILEKFHSKGLQAECKS